MREPRMRNSGLAMRRQGVGTPGKGTTGDDAKTEERLRALNQKRERLAFAVERLGLQARQKERQLRKSMAAN